MKNESKKTTSKKTSTSNQSANQKKGKAKSTQKKTITPKKEINQKNIQAKRSIPKETIEEKKGANFINQGSVMAIILALVVITSILAKNFIMNEKKDFSKSYLISHKIIAGELNNTDLEATLKKERSFILVTSLDNEEEYNLEKSLRTIIEKQKLQSDFYIYDKEKNNLTDIVATFHLEEQIKTPTILYYRNGNLVDSVSREDEKMIEAADFQKLLDIYEMNE